MASGAKRYRKLAASPLSASTVKALDAMSDMWAAVEKAREKAQLNVGHERPENGFTVQEYSEKYSLNYQTASGQLQRMTKSGLLTAHAVMLPASNGRLQRMTVYVPR